MRTLTRTTLIRTGVLAVLVVVTLEAAFDKMLALGVRRCGLLDLARRQAAVRGPEEGDAGRMKNALGQSLISGGTTW